MCSTILYENQEIETVKELKNFLYQKKGNDFQIINSYGYETLHDDWCLCQVSIGATLHINNIEYVADEFGEFTIIGDLHNENNR